MKKTKKKINNGLIVMSKGERAAVISLLSVIAVLLAFSVFRPAINFNPKDEQAFHNLDSLISLQERVNASQSSTLPQTTSSKKDDRPSESSSPSPSPSTITSQKPAESSKKISPPSIPILDINVADSLALVALPQIGEVMASRIHRYRERLGGFVLLEQLYEVKGMDTARFTTIQPYIILENKEIRKLEVNRDEFKTLLRHPYLEYDQVKAIVNHRERKGLIKDWEQLKEITGEVNPLLEKYVGY